MGISLPGERCFHVCGECKIDPVGLDDCCGDCPECAGRIKKGSMDHHLSSCHGLVLAQADSDHEREGR